MHVSASRQGALLIDRRRRPTRFRECVEYLLEGCTTMVDHHAASRLHDRGDVDDRLTPWELGHVVCCPMRRGVARARTWWRSSACAHGGEITSLCTRFRPGDSPVDGKRLALRQQASKRACAAAAAAAAAPRPAPTRPQIGAGGSRHARRSIEQQAPPAPIPDAARGAGVGVETASRQSAHGIWHRYHHRGQRLTNRPGQSQSPIVAAASSPQC